jgi:hypothetical protein
MTPRIRAGARGGIVTRTGVSARYRDGRKDDIRRQSVRVPGCLDSVGDDVALGARKRAPDGVVLQVGLMRADAGERAFGVTLGI